MNIQNINPATIQEIHDLLGQAEDLDPVTLKDLLLRSQHKITHALFALETIWENCCDPSSSIIELNTKLKSCSVWAFADAPIEYQKLSEHGGDEDWVIFAPTEFDEFAESYLVDRLAVCDSDSYEVDGGRVYITAHA